MTLATPTILPETPRRQPRVRLAMVASHMRFRLSPAALPAALDLCLLVLEIALCGFLFFEGGLEALMGGASGAVLAGRHGAPLTAGAFAGLFAGALFAGFFHGALINLINALS